MALEQHQDGLISDSQSENPQRLFSWMDHFRQLSLQSGFSACQIVPHGPARAVSAQENSGLNWKQNGLGIVEVGEDYIAQRVEALQNNPQLLAKYLAAKVYHEAGHVIAFSQQSPFMDSSRSEGYADLAGINPFYTGTKYSG
jgi:hypothetical protein